MPKILHFMMIVLVTCVGLVPRLQADQDMTAVNSVSTYRLGAGDKIKIQVYGEPDMGVEAKLSDAGTLVHPVLGEIKAAGLSIGDLSAAMVEELKGPYLVDPKVSVNILEYREYYVNGEVQKPGAYHYEPGLTVHKAVSVAGGFTQRASRTSITLVDDKDPTQTPKEVELNTPVNPGDILMIEESFF
ncbi:MAG: polysaccharide export protein [Methylococcales bacterium]|nr:polysaccharide export protein [Methylococcales bacterium]